MEEIVRLAPTADLASIRRILEEAPRGRVILVVPRGCAVLQDPVSLALVRRWGGELAKEVAVVSPSLTLRQMASRVGLPTASSPRGLPRGAYQRGSSLLAPDGKRSPERLRRIVARREGLRRGYGWAFPRRSWWRELVKAVGFVLALGVLVLGFMLLLVPEAEVVLVPAQKALEAGFPLRAEMALDQVHPTENRVPARTVEAALVASGRVAAVAEKDVPDGFAKGVATFFNKRGEPIGVPLGTIVSTSGGTPMRFRTVEALQVPAGVGSRAEVEINALAPGPGGNVPAFSINWVEEPLALQVAVQNLRPTSGGTVKKASYITSEDKKRLEASLLARLQQEASSELLGRLKEEEILVPESIAVEPLSLSYDRAVGEEAESLSLVMQARARGLALDGRDIKELALRELAQGAQQGFELWEDQIVFHLGRPTKIEEGAMELPVSATVRAVAKVSPAQVKGLVAGLPREAARTKLGERLALAEEPEIRLSPPWMGRLPWLHFRIRVRLRAG